MVATTRPLHIFALVAGFVAIPEKAEALTDKSSLVSLVRPALLQNENLILNTRGGATSLEVEDDLEIESSDEEEYEDEEEEEEEELDPKLAKSAQSSVAKTKAKAAASVKEAVNAKLEKPEKKKKSGLLKLFKIPYIIKALVNPMVLVQMTKGYFASLVNLNYLDENKDPSEDLRSALEAKAKKGGTSGSRGKRKMKPGQAKTLSDLPQLNT